MPPQDDAVQAFRTLLKRNSEFQEGPLRSLRIELLIENVVIIKDRTDSLRSKFCEDLCFDAGLEHTWFVDQAQAFRKWIDAQPTARRRTAGTQRLCDRCESVAHARGLCYRHYRRQLKAQKELGLNSWKTDNVIRLVLGLDDCV